MTTPDAAAVADFAITDRGSIIENRHAVHAAIVDARTGRLLYAVARARAMLARVGDGDYAEGDLRCGGHAAVSDAVNRAWIKRGFVPGPLCDNCSGKHGGVMAGARAVGGADCVATHHLPDNPMQVRVKRTFEELCGAGGGGRMDVRWATDGCNLPAPACPLHGLARCYALFAAAAREEVRTRQMARVFDAMSRYPEQVGGQGRFCTLLMNAYGGALVGKIGADGCYVKIEDGSIEILYAVVVEILEQLDVGTPAMRQELAAFHHLKRWNTAQVVTGKMSLPFNVWNHSPVSF
ncbi:L-asparaginase II [Macrophomina phaseolina]|uniref:L-asparaginase II n=1 Tax=Macrophomina phaseolina TaxID=35725 RepID=A0ABQ8GK87_9PEZI|nr:L-asparaginase II [Macrophomina phaseolina]